MKREMRAFSRKNAASGRTKLFWIYSFQKISLTAGKDISMMDEKEHHETIHEYHSHVSGLLSSKTKDLYEAGKTDTVRGSLISGNETHMESGRDMTITGSAVASSKDTTLWAGRNFKAESAEERSGSTYRESVKKRGLLSGGGLGVTLGSEKRKDRYDSESVEQVGSTIGSVEGNVRMGAGKDAAILGSEVTAGKNISISGENVNLQHTENTYSSLEKHEMARSGLSVSLGGRTVETVHSIAAPLMRAGEVEDARLKGLYAFQAGQTAGQLIREEKDAEYVVESLRHNASESANMWEKARDWDAADRIENSRLGKKNSFALDIALGSSKSKSEIESTAHVIKGSMIHGENTVSVTADKDISVSGSRIEGRNVNLEAGRHILITAGENRMVEKQNAHSTSGNMGVSLGVEGIQGIRGGYSSGKGKEEETSRTYEDSRIKAENTLTLVSGKDTAVKGGKLEGDRVKGVVGGSLSLETVQDEKSYHEESHSAGISLSYDFAHGKSGVSGGLSKENRQSHYESASSQSGIYAGDEGFDISVKDNTHLKGAVIDSKGDAEKNTLRTGTLSWEDVENKADYKAGGMGISYNPKDSTTPLNARGLTPQMSPTVKDKADSSTKAAIAKGTIVITDKKNQGQDISTLNRDTENSLNRLKEIFDKSKVEEKQELLGMMEKYGNQAIHAYAESRGWKDGSAEKVLLHGAFGALMGDMGTGETLAGALSGSIHEYVMGYLNRMKSPEWVRTHPDAVEWLSAGLGAVIGKVSDASISGMAGISLDAAKWNEYQNIRELRDKIERLKTSGALNRLRDNEYAVLYAEHNGTTVGVAVDKEGNATDVNLIEGPKEQYFQLGEGISLGSYGKRTTVNETTTLQEYLQKPFDERTTNGRRTIYEARQYDGNIYRPGFYKEDVDKLMNNPLWKKADMLLKISGPAINEYVPNNLGAGFNRGYGYFSRARTLYISDDKGEATAGLLGAYGANRAFAYMLIQSGMFQSTHNIYILIGEGWTILGIGFLGGELGKSMYNGIKDNANRSIKKAGEIYSDTQNGGLEKSNDIQD
jgi:filamentous hemagglutinin